MLIEQPDGTYHCGPLDVVCILHDVGKGRFHAAFFEEKPFPGPVPSVAETDIVRLKSKMHHTGGADTLEEALVHLQNLVDQLNCPEPNVWREPREWDGVLGIVWVVPNWTK